MRPTRSARHRSTIGQIRKGCPQSAAEPPRSITSVRMIFFMLSSSFRCEDNILLGARPLDARKHTTGSVTLHRKALAYSAAPGAVQPALYGIWFSTMKNEEAQLFQPLDGVQRIKFDPFFSFLKKSFQKVHKSILSQSKRRRAA